MKHRRLADMVISLRSQFECVILATSRRRSIVYLVFRLPYIIKGSLKNKNSLVFCHTVFLLNRLVFRLPNLSQLVDAAAHSPTSSRTEHSFFREKACACSTTRIARLVRTRRKKDAE